MPFQKAQSEKKNKQKLIQFVQRHKSSLMFTNILCELYSLSLSTNGNDRRHKLVL